MKHVLTVDVETYSEADLASCGLYRYMDDPGFEVLLIGYALDDGSVKVIDLTDPLQREFLPDFVKLLCDPDILKVAHNAAFEREALRKLTGEYQPPEQWLDTMVLAAVCGLPMSLDQAGKALGFGSDYQKDAAGKALIKLFSCPRKPTKNNPVTRVLPEYQPEKWKQYIEYNRQDVVSEREIYRLLKGWAPDEREHRLWCLDARMNEHGVRIDRTLAEQAVALGYREREELTEKAVALTGLDNPNSVSQIKSWLKEQEGVEVMSLNKRAIGDVYASLQGDTAREFLDIRSALSKSSVKKYDGMLRCICADDHARGCFQFYGAGRTGRFCLTGDHEVLTDEGWARLDEWKGGSIAVWNPSTEAISFQKSAALKFDYNGPVLYYEDKRISQISTPEHKMWAKPRYDKEWQAMTVEEMSSCRPSIPMFGYSSCLRGIEDTHLRILIMTQADGCYTDEDGLHFGFFKDRKVERCKMLLRRAGIPFTYKEYPQGDKTRKQIKVAKRNIPMWLRMFRQKTFGDWLLSESADVVFDELKYWDSYSAAPNSFQYSTCNRQNADMIQALAHLNGRTALLKVRVRGEEHPNWNDSYILDIWENPTNSHNIKVKPLRLNFEGIVYCPSTPTGYFLVRRNGKVWVTGNSGKLIQFQNLPQNHMYDLDVARQLVRAGDYETVKALYDTTAGTLSELIRTALIPEPGHILLIADYSAIEARVLAWIAGEEWRLETFRNGGDIYCASASQMFKVPVIKHGINGELRQKGKIAELALGYGGGVGALKAFGADKLGMTEEEMGETVAKWRESSPHVVALWKDLERAAAKCASRKVSTRANCGVRFDYEEAIMWMTLPSGRRIAYYGAEYSEDSRRNGKSLSYMGRNQTTGKWERIQTWGGKLVENLIQAAARDCLREALIDLEDEGWTPIATVHDEIICTEPIGGRTWQDLAAVMSRIHPWEQGLPLTADGYETPYYKKD